VVDIIDHIDGQMLKTMVAVSDIPVESEGTGGQ